MEDIIREHLKKNTNIKELTDLLGKVFIDKSRSEIILAINRVIEEGLSASIADSDWESLSIEERYPTKSDGFYFLKVDQKGNETWRPDNHGLTKYFINELKLRTHDSGSYLYNGKFYDHLSQLHLKKIILENTEIREPSSIAIKNFYELAKVGSYSKIEDDNSTDGLINLNNGILSVKDKELLEHHPKYFFRYALPHNYEEQAECPVFDQFLKTIFDNDQERIDLAIEIIAYCLMGGRPFLEKAFVLVGDGANGKSTYINIIRALMGERNCSALPMSKIGDERAVYTLDGKLVNLVDESPSDEISSEAFKNIVSGGQVYARDVFAQGYYFKNKARLIFASNKMPYFKDTTYGNLRKLCFLGFDRTIEKVDMDKFIEDKLIAELPGILNRAISKIGLEDLTYPRHSESMMEEYKLDADIVYRFCREMIDSSNTPNMFVPALHIYDTFREWSERENYSKQNFGNRAFYKKFENLMRRSSTIIGNKKITLTKRLSNKKLYYSGIFVIDDVSLSKYAELHPD